MKVLGLDDVLVFLPVTAEEKQTLAQQYLSRIPEEAKTTADTLENAQKCPSLLICVNEKPAFHLWFSVEDKTLNGEAVVSLDNGFHPNVYFEALEKLAKSLGCNRIRIGSKLSGQIKLASRNGYQLEAVTMTKDL